MARTKQTQKKGPPTSSSSSSTGHEEEIEEERPIRQPSRQAVKKIKYSAAEKGEGAASTSRPRSKVASGIRYNHNIGLSHLEQRVVVVHRPSRTTEDSGLVDFTKGANDMRTLRLSMDEDPRLATKQFLGDPRFWLNHQAD